MSARVEPRLLKGFRDFLPAEEAGRASMLARIARAFELCGFAPLSTPAIEYADVLLGKYGVEGEKLLYRFTDNGGRDVALRYDLTVPLARVAAQYRDLPKPFRRYQVGTVWRAEKPAHGRFREFMQCDADIVGTASPLADADCIAAGVMALHALDVTRFVVRVGNRAVLNGLLAAAGVVDPGVCVEVLRVLDKMDKVGPDAVRAMLEALEGVGSEASSRLLTLLDRAQDDPAGVGLPEAAQAGRAQLLGVLEAVRAMGLGDHVRVDLRIARGLDYYTGNVYETMLSDLPGVGSVMSGGRYDSLLEMYGVPAIPSVGISIGVDRLFAALAELGRAPTGGVGPALVVCPMGDAALAPALGLLASVRQAGVAAEAAPEPTARLKKQLEYATRRGARFVAILGDSEVGEGVATVKDFRTGEQVRVPWAQVAAHVTDAG